METQNISPYYAPGVQSIDEIIADTFGVTVEGMKDIGRKRENVDARHFAMWFRINNSRDSFAKIGSIYGGRDHATVYHAQKKVIALMDTDPRYRDMALEALEKLENAGHLKKKTKKIAI